MTEVYYSAKHWAKKAEEWASQAAGVTSFNGRVGTVTLASADVTGALGYTPYNSTNPSGYITGITSAMVTTALGYTPYDATNPAGYTTNVGTVTSVNNVNPVNGNVTLSIPTVYDSTITIQKNGTNVDSFTTNASSNKSINITVPTQASDVNALPSSTKYGADLSLTSGTLQLLDQDGNNLGNSVSLPDPSLKANVGLDNLTSTGKNIGNWSSNVTNCIINIPQDIKLELNNGTLTLKAGSKVYVPNGFEQDGTTPKFDEYIIPNDYSTDSVNANQTDFHFWNVTQGYFGRVVMNKVISSPTAPLNPSNYLFWYNTTDNIIKRYIDNEWVSDIFSLPVCLATMDDTKYTLIDQVFNGFGYMGSTVFVLPGVKGLIPNGRNADGTLKSIEFTVSSVLINQNTGSNRNGTYIQYYNGDLTLNRVNKDAYSYNEQENQYRKTSDGTITERILVANTVGDISSFSSSSAFHAVDYNDRGIISGFSMPSIKGIDLTLGATGTSYTAPANGWFLLRKTPNSTNQYIDIVNDGGCNIEFECFKPTGGGTIAVSCPAKKGDIVRIYYNAGGDTGRFRFIYAEGEV